MAGFDASSILPGDFNILSDELSDSTLTIKLKSLSFTRPVGSLPTSPSRETTSPVSEETKQPHIETYAAVARFSYILGGEARERCLNLRHDVRFVTAHPCVPNPQNLHLLNSKAGPAMARLAGSPGGSDSMCMSTSPDIALLRNALTLHSVHPLHKAFTYLQVPLSLLLTASPNLSLSTLLASSSEKDTTPSVPGTSTTIPKVLIINCIDPSIRSVSAADTIASTTTINSHNHDDDNKQETREEGDQKVPAASANAPVGLNRHTLSPKHSFGNDTEMLARALCSDRGWDALISRRGRGCLACAVREAAALRWRVILRFG